MKFFVGRARGGKVKQLDVKGVRDPDGNKVAAVCQGFTEPQ
jgi:hypothetical protein